MTPRNWLRALAAVLVMLSADAGRAEEPTELPAAAPQARPELDSSRNSILLMRDGGIISGRILPSGDDYLVRRPNGNLHVPGTLVRLHCQDLQTAHQRLHQKAAEQADPAEHVALARWCVTNHMLNEARQELRAALALDPGRNDARRLLARLEDLEKTKSALAAAAHTRNDASMDRLPGETEESESLGGLSPGVARQFTRRIQPILVNNCSTAGCHGRESDNGFRLERVVAGQNASRFAAERNLAQVLKYVSLDHPAESALVVEPQANHGRRGRQPFGGRGGHEQIRELKQWVNAVARDLSREKRAQANAADQRQLQASNASAPPQSRATAAGQAKPGQEHSGRARAASVDGNEAVAGKSAEVDPFDPAVFNNQGAGNAAPAAARRRR